MIRRLMDWACPASVLRMDGNYERLPDDLLTYLRANLDDPEFFIAWVTRRRPRRFWRA